jgi:hypothetical protein
VIKNNLFFHKIEHSKYLGCFNDSTERDLNYSGIFPTAIKSLMTVSICIDICKNPSQPFAGLQFG